MLNFSWGTKIAALYIGFILMIGVMVTMSVRQHIDLVSEDYYAKELAFQDKINAMNNAMKLEGKITCSTQEDSLRVSFPPDVKRDGLSGEINFFRPSDAAADVRFRLDLDEDATQSFALHDLKKGMYKMQVAWNVDGQDYFTEQIVVIP